MHILAVDAVQSPWPSDCDCRSEHTCIAMYIDWPAAELLSILFSSIDKYIQLVAAHSIPNVQFGRTLFYESLDTA